MCLNESDWNITFHDDFNGNQLNTSNWKAVNNQTQKIDYSASSSLASIERIKK